MFDPRFDHNGPRNGQKLVHSLTLEAQHFINLSEA